MPNSKIESDMESEGEFEGEFEAALYEDSVSNDIEQPIRPKVATCLKWLRRLAITVMVIAGLAAGGVYLLLQMAQSEPEFYRQALKVDPKIQRKNGSEMETRLLDLRNSVLTSETWTASFTEPQINGWLAWDLNKKFPGLVPSEVTDPQLVVGDKSITLAFHCSLEPFRGVAVIDADVFLTGVINQVGIRIKSIHSGMIPIPIAAVADQLTKQARKSGVELKWNNEGADTVAIIDLPDSMIKPDEGSYIELETLEIKQGKISIGGVTHPPDF